jgi:hypothetical protein
MNNRLNFLLDKHNPTITLYLANYLKINKDDFLSIPINQDNKFSFTGLETRFYFDSNEFSFYNDLVDDFYNTFLTSDVNLYLKDHIFLDGTTLIDAQKKIEKEDKHFHFLKEESIKDELYMTIPILINYIYFVLNYKIDDESFKIEENTDVLMAYAFNVASLNKKSLLLVSTFSGSASNKCYDCGETLRLAFDPNKMCIYHYFTDGYQKDIDYCDYVKNDNVIKLKVKIPSGKIVFANDLRSILDKISKNAVDKGKKSMDSFKGIKENASLYNKKCNMIYSYMVETYPHVIKNSEKEIVITSPWLHGEHFHNDSDYEFERSDYVDTIDQYLWAFTAMDQDLFLSLTKDKSFENEYFTVDVEAGEYEFIDYFNSDKNVPYHSIFRKI